jgi:hypothetical protein
VEGCFARLGPCRRHSKEENKRDDDSFHGLSE